MSSVFFYVKSSYKNPLHTSLYVLYIKKPYIKNPSAKGKGDFMRLSAERDTAANAERD